MSSDIIDIHTKEKTTGGGEPPDTVVVLTETQKLIKKQLEFFMELLEQGSLTAFSGSGLVTNDIALQPLCTASTSAGLHKMKSLLEGSVESLTQACYDDVEGDIGELYSQSDE